MIQTKFVELSMYFVMSLCMGVSSSVFAQTESEKTREIVGTVLKVPIYRDAIQPEAGSHRGDKLRAAILPWLIHQYRLQHEQGVVPTESEILAVINSLAQSHHESLKEREPEMRARLLAIKQKLADSGLSREEQQNLKAERQTLQAELTPPGRVFALFMLNNWKLQKHLYENYGGGRVLWQQAGMEAFDATHKWLLSEEEKGSFQIADAELRADFYHYWTTMPHGPFLVDDEERIQKEFLTPAWLGKP